MKQLKDMTSINFSQHNQNRIDVMELTELLTSVVIFAIPCGNVKLNCTAELLQSSQPNTPERSSIDNRSNPNNDRHPMPMNLILPTNWAELNDTSAIMTDQWTRNANTFEAITLAGGYYDVAIINTNNHSPSQPHVMKFSE